MAKAFLAKVLTIENCVTFECSQDCVICQEKCGTLSPETGIMELEVRLPCGHTAGSACIANWLANSNTCPLCRHEFFPRQPRPYMEHETIQNTEDEEPVYELGLQSHSAEELLTRLTSHSEPDGNPLALALTYAHQLHLSPPVAFLALGIADTADNMTVLRNGNEEAIAAASVYIASYILNQPRSLTDVGRLTVISEREIFNVYRTIYYDRYELVDEDWRQIVGGTTLGEAAEALPTLPWPPLQHHIDGPEEMDDDRGLSTIGGLEIVKELCFDFHADNDNNVDNEIDIRIWRMAHHVAEQMETMNINWQTTNPWTIAAACTYMASHLVFQGKTFDEISAKSGIPSDSIRNTYQLMRRLRELIVQEHWFETFFWTRENAIYCLPEP